MRPLPTSASIFPTSTYNEEGDNRNRPNEYLTKRRAVLFCFGCCIFTVVLLGFILLILAITVFKVKDPELSVIGIHVEGLKDAVSSNSSSAKARMTADVSIKNRNAASFKLKSSKVAFSCRGEVVGVGSVPEGVVSAGHVRRINVTVPVVTRRIASPGNIAGGRPTGSVNLTTYTEIKGRVNLFGIFRRYLYVFINCEMTLELSLNEQDARNLLCGTKTL